MASHFSHALDVPIYGSLYTIPLTFEDASTGLPAAPTSLDAEVSKDGGTFANCTNSVTLIKEVGGVTDSPHGYLTLARTEMSAALIMVQVKSSNCKTVFAIIVPFETAAITSGDCQAGTSSTVTLHSGAESRNHAYVGCWVRITAGTGIGQARYIGYYVGSTRIAWVYPDWETTPDATSDFVVIPPPSVMRRAQVFLSADTHTGATVPTVTDVSGKVLGGGSSTITGTGAWVVDASGNNVATASVLTKVLDFVRKLAGSQTKIG